MALRRVLPVALLSLLPLFGAVAEPVLLEVHVGVEEGEAVFVTSELPMMGAGNVKGSLRMATANGQNWHLRLDVPPGASITPRYYARLDDPARLFDGGNGRFLGVGEGVQGEPGVTMAVTPMDGYRQALESAAIVSPAPGIAPRYVSFSQDALKLEIPAASVLSGLELLAADGASFRLAGSDIWLREDGVYRFETRGVHTPTRIEEFEFAPHKFLARRVRVMLPRGYDENSNFRYPVIYAQDGQNVFSPGGAFGSWDLDLTVSDLISRGEIPEVIVVAIDNTNERIREYMPEYAAMRGENGRGGEFLVMIRDELMPIVNERYRTMPGPEDTVHVGSSLGGLLGYEAARMKETFGTVIAMSPSFWINRAKVMEEAMSGPETRARLYIDSGTAGNSNDGYKDTLSVRDALMKSGHALGEDFMHVVGYHRTGGASGQPHQHNEAAWRERAPEALRWAFAKHR